MTKNFHIQQEISRLLTAAVINGSFRKALLNDPGRAISSGFGGEVFNLGSDVVQRVSNIQANSLADFATQLSQL
ncbi:MAG: hypothetical protein SVR81_03375 [Chloroflexota bacterium]|nr:hypothetical protein [Chloroflexota bacterium]